MKDIAQEVYFARKVDFIAPTLSTTLETNLNNPHRDIFVQALFDTVRSRQWHFVKENCAFIFLGLKESYLYCTPKTIELHKRRYMQPREICPLAGEKEAGRMFTKIQQAQNTVKKAEKPKQDPTAKKAVQNLLDTMDEILDPEIETNEKTAEAQRALREHEQNLLPEESADDQIILRDSLSADGRTLFLIMSSLTGRILNIMEAAIADKEQRAAVKTLIKKEFRKDMNKFQDWKLVKPEAPSV